MLTRQQEQDERRRLVGSNTTFTFFDRASADVSLSDSRLARTLRARPHLSSGRDYPRARGLRRQTCPAWSQAWATPLNGPSPLVSITNN
jgi:hypothetical protein